MRLPLADSAAKETEGPLPVHPRNAKMSKKRRNNGRNKHGRGHVRPALARPPAQPLIPVSAQRNCIDAAATSPARGLSSSQNFRHNDLDVVPSCSLGTGGDVSALFVLASPSPSLCT